MSRISLDLRIRPATPKDASALCEILNTIIEIGGTTAMETPLTIAQFNDHFLTGPAFLSCLVAEAPDFGVLGFQALSRHPDLPADWADIATFSKAEPKIAGVGTALLPNPGRLWRHWALSQSTPRFGRITQARSRTTTRWASRRTESSMPSNFGAAGPWTVF